MSTTKIKKKHFTKKRKTNKYIIKKRKTNKYKNQHTTKQSHKNKKRKNMKKYAYNMKGGGPNKHVFIRPYYDEYDDSIFVEPLGDIYYYGDFDLKITETEVKDIDIHIKDLLTPKASEIANKYTRESIEFLANKFPSSNSRPKLNKQRTLYDKTLKDEELKEEKSKKLSVEDVRNFLVAIQEDIATLNIIETKFKTAAAKLLKAPDRKNRCNIKIVKEGNSQQWIFKIVDGDNKIGTVHATYYLNSNFTDIFEDIFKLGKTTASRNFNVNTSQYTTFGSDLWFIYVKVIQHFLPSIITENDATTKENYLKCIIDAFDLMTATSENTQKLTSSNAQQDIIHLYNDSLDNDIDDILAIICLEYLYRLKNIKDSLKYTEKPQFRWVNSDHTEYETTKKILLRLRTKIEEIIAEKKPLFTKIEPETIVEPGTMSEPEPELELELEPLFSKYK